ncbi:PREDICTED: thaumatin-like protein 1, partial [Rhagoletis zephyria]|uniref:thaumatin-like protein 1 n=1 Tax=Rhagoletis zephyria TaxID=28612 RepID=UPI00081161A3
ANNDCHRNGPTTPATVVYIALDSLHQQDYYQLSLADGFNVPVEVEPLNHPNNNIGSNNGSYNAIGGHCIPAGCKADLNQVCPPELAVKSKVGGQESVVVGCRSPCQAFSTDQYCCTGAHRPEAKCNSTQWPTDYSKLFHQSCPDAKAYPRDTVAQPKYCEANAVRLNVNFCLKKH